MPEDATWEVVSESPPLRLVLSPGAARVIGRNGERGADFLISHVTVARRHAALGNRGGVLEIEDLGSHSGIFVNEEARRGKVPLSDGDEVRVGGVRLRVRRLPPGA